MTSEHKHTSRGRIFLCHSSADKAAVRNLNRRLITDRFDPWFDEEDLRPGEDWELAIRRAVRMSEYVIVCLSRTSTTRAGFVHKEIKLALDVADEQPEGAIFVIPARLEACGVPERLRHLQWVDLFDDSGYHRLARVLLGDPNPPTDLQLDTVRALTRSDIQVLLALDQSATVDQAAQTLFISITTVLSILRRIQQKLGVQTRFEAFDSARILGLLAPGFEVGAPVSIPHPRLLSEPDFGVYEGAAPDYIIAGRLDGQQERIPMGNVRHNSDGQVHPPAQCDHSTVGRRCRQRLG